MVQLKPCPQLYIDLMKAKADRTGEKHLVFFDTVLDEFRVMSQRAFTGCGMNHNTRYDVRASYPA